MKLRTNLDMQGNEIKAFTPEKVTSLPDTNLFTGRCVLLVTPGVSPAPDTGEYYCYTGTEWKPMAESGANKKNVILIQDSYGTRNGSGTAISTSVPEELESILNVHDYNLYHKATNGAGFCNGKFLENLTYVADEIVDDKNSIGDIWVLGGWNDEIQRYSQTEEQLKTAMEALITYAHTTFPNANVHLAFISYGFKYSSLSTLKGYTGVEKALDIYRESTKLGFLYEGRLETVLHNRDYMVSDLAHPNADGCKYIAARLADLILTGDTHIHHRHTTILDENNISSYTLEDWSTNLAATHGTIRIDEEVIDDVYTFRIDTDADNFLFKVNTGYHETDENIGANTFKLLNFQPYLMRVANSGFINLIASSIIAYIPENEENNIGLPISFKVSVTPNKVGSSDANKLYIRTPYVSSDYITWKPIKGKLKHLLIGGCQPFTCNAMALTFNRDDDE